MRWLLVGIVAIGAACERPKVLEASDDAGAPPEDASPTPDPDSARDLMEMLARARSSGDPAAIAGLYAEGSRIVQWRGSSSWLLSPASWAEELAERGADVTLLTTDTVKRGRWFRVIAAFDELVGTRHMRVLASFELDRRGSAWVIGGEAELDRIDLDEHPLGGYSRAILADLSYRAPPEIAVLRLRGHSPTDPDLSWSALQGEDCPDRQCRIELGIDLLLSSPDGNKLLESPIDLFRGPCAEVPAVSLAGAVRVYERDALVIERSALPCGDEVGEIAIVGARGTSTVKLLALERSRVVEVREDSVIVEHSPAPGEPFRKVTFVPQKQESELVFRAEPPPNPSPAKR